MSAYPPILESTITPFLITGALTIPFSLSTLNSGSDIWHIGVRVIKVSSNTSVVNTATHSDGVVYCDLNALSDGTYSVSLSTGTDITVVDGEFYRVQLRAGTASKWTANESFSDWKNDQVSTTGALSDWSTTAMTRAISEPFVEISNSLINIGLFGSYEKTTAPLFVGSFKCATVEPASQYRFRLFDNNTTSRQLIEDSGWITRGRSAESDSFAGTAYFTSTDTHRFNTTLQHYEDYCTEYSVITLNGYTPTSANYEFTVASIEASITLSGYSLEVYDESVFAMENGCMEIVLSTDDIIAKNLVISRADNQHNFTVWEDLKFIQVEGRQLEEEIIHRDFTVESGVLYKYRIQTVNVNDERSSPLYENGEYDHESAPSRECNLSYAFLLNEPVQLSIKYNSTVSSYKHTALASKADSLGGKYPTILRSGEAYYAEFTIGGLISFHSDEYNTFFTLGDDGYYYKDELVIPKSKYSETVLSSFDGSEIERYVEVPTFNTDLTSNNVFIERKFREKVEEFLNDGDYKLFRSSTEGNFTIALINVSLTPEQTLGRMIYSFSATAYEVLDTTLENLDEYDIIDIGEYTALNLDGYEITTYGQISGWYSGSSSYDNDYQVETSSTPENLMSEIVRDSWSHNPKSIVSVDALTFEAYPETELIGDLTVAQYESKNAETEEEKEYWSDKVNRLILTKDYIDTHGSPSSLNLRVEGTNITVKTGKMYSVEELGLTPASSVFLEKSAPVIVDYKCTATLYDDTELTSEYAIAYSLLSSASFEDTYGPISQSKDRYHYSQVNGIIVDLSSASQYESTGSDVDFVIRESTDINVYITQSLKSLVVNNLKNYLEDLTDLTIKADWTNAELYDGQSTIGFFYKYKHLSEVTISTQQNCMISVLTTESEDYQEIVIGPSMQYNYKSEDSLHGIVDIILPEHKLFAVDFTLTLMQATREQV